MLAGLFTQQTIPLQRKDTVGEPPGDRGGVARSGADLEYPVAGLYSQRVKHQSLEVEALDRLAALDRHHALRPGHRLPLRGHEQRPRRRLDGGEQRPVVNAARAHAQQERRETFPPVSGRLHASAFLRRSWIS